MTKAKDNSEKEAARPADFGRVADAPVEPSAESINPLMSSFAAATAIGFNFASQMAGAMLGSFQGAMEATSKLARTLEEERKAASTASEPVADLNEAPVAKAKPPEADLRQPEVIAPAPAKTEAAQTEKVRKAATAKAKTAEKVKPTKVSKTKPVVAKDKAVVAKAEKAGPSAVGGKTAKATTGTTAEAKSAVTKPAKAKITATKPAKAAGRKANSAADDLKLISGIGPKVEQVLNGMGISRYADIAGWSAEDMARVDGEIGFSGRIERDDWVGQAKALMGSKG